MLLILFPKKKKEKMKISSDNLLVFCIICLFLHSIGNHIIHLLLDVLLNKVSHQTKFIDYTVYLRPFHPNSSARSSNVHSCRSAFLAFALIAIYTILVLRRKNHLMFVLACISWVMSASSCLDFYIESLISQLCYYGQCQSRATNTYS